MTTIEMSADEFENYDFNRECLQADINKGYSPHDWDLDDKRFLHEILNPRGLFVRDVNGNIIDFSAEFALLDFINSK